MSDLHFLERIPPTLDVSLYDNVYLRLASLKDPKTKKRRPAHVYVRPYKSKDGHRYTFWALCGAMLGVRRASIEPRRRLMEGDFGKPCGSCLRSVDSYMQGRDYRGEHFDLERILVRTRIELYKQIAELYPKAHVADIDVLYRVEAGHQEGPKIGVFFVQTRPRRSGVPVASIKAGMSDVVGGRSLNRSVDRCVSNLSRRFMEAFLQT